MYSPPYNNSVMLSNPFLRGDNYYRAVFRAYGDINRNENPYMLVCPSLEVVSADMDDIIRSLQGYIHRYNLGAGNLPSVTVVRNNKPVVKIQYNGQVQHI